MKQPYFGVDYYPEHWPRARWETDARLMQEMGLKVVRMAEFSWHKLEPEPGVFDFAWLDEAIALLAAHGIQTVLGTPTAAPPAWLINRQPDILPTDWEGRRRTFGGRHHDCQSNPQYRAEIRTLVTAMARHYAQNPNVIGWQPDNELGNSHDELCTCPYCRRAFQDWLRRKYGTMQELNRAWGTAFWSQEYNDFAEVFTPGLTVTGQNPSELLDWKRFHSDLIVDFLHEQTAILRRECPHQFITHNFMGFADTVDYYDLAKELDFVSHDQYPGDFSAGTSFADPADMAAALDVVRSYKNAPFWMMEQQAGPTGWQILGHTPAPGQLALWSVQSIAHGADTVVWFRWRTCAMGTEQYWHGILPHSGQPGRRYAELKELVQTLTPLMDEVAGQIPQNEVGIVFDFAQDYAWHIQPHHPELDYRREVRRWYKALYENNIPADFVPQDADFARYKLLIAPMQYLMTPELEQKYFAYVQNGGHLILTMRTGVKDATNLCMTDAELPGRLAELAGVTVLDYDCLRDGPAAVSDADGEHSGSYWADILTPAADTEILARYADHFYAGQPVVTAHPYGKGRCVYVGTVPDDAWQQKLAAREAALAGAAPLGKVHSGVELARRGSFLFAMNHNDTPATAEPAGKWTPLLPGGNDLPAYGFQIYKENTK